MASRTILRIPCADDPEADCRKHKHTHGQTPRGEQPWWTPCGDDEIVDIKDAEAVVNRIRHYCRLWKHDDSHECSCGHRW